MTKLLPRLLVIGLLFLLVLSASACVAPPQGGGGGRWDQTAAKIQDTLNQALSAYERGDQATAQQRAKDAYFDVFESSGLETAIRLSISAQRAFEVEYGFTQVNQLLRSGAKPDAVRQQVAELMALIRENTARLGGSQSSSVGDFLASFLILVREGFEAILILGAIIAYLIKSGNADRVRTIYQSALLAILASLATAVAVRYLFRISGASQELLEGVTMLLAVAVLFSVSFWLIRKVEAKKWQQYIQSKVARSLTRGSSIALWWAAFLAVYREGAETVLFYQALFSGASQGSIGAMGLGIGVGAVVLVVIFVAIRYGSVRLPLKPFFLGTSIFLYYMAFVFAGQGMRELQEAGAVGRSLIPGLSAIDILGFYPTWEGLGLQLILLLTAATGLAYQFIYKPRASVAKGGTGM